VAFVNIFHLIDESALEGWQSGLYYFDETAKKSAQTVTDWLWETGGACRGIVHPWTPPGITPAPFVVPTFKLKPPSVVPATQVAGPKGQWIAVGQYRMLE
jgi:hypothetical protein